MRLLFVCGATVVDDKLQCASWIRSIISYIDDEFDITIAGSGIGLSDNKSLAFENKQLHLLNLSSSTTIDKLSVQLSEAHADVMILFGTENPFHFRILKACKQAGLLDKTVVFAQGLCCVCAQHYAEGVPERVIRRYTVRDLIRRQNINKERASLYHRAEDEKTTLELTRHFIGRTTMDQAILRKFNQTASYYKCNDVLRSCFYDGQWQYADCVKHSIFVSQYYYPLKGFHYLLEAVAQLKDKYPDIRITAAGYNPIQKSLTKKELKDSSYIRYIKSLVKEYDLQDHIELLGELSADRMREEYLKANVFVMPSTIENSPNSLAEAMMLGIPTVAADVGGVTDYVKHREEAYIYPSSATYLLAYYVDKVFSDEEKAEIIGIQGKQRAESEYNRDKNIMIFEETMRRIAQKS